MAADGLAMVQIPAEFHDLFEKRTIGHLATVLPNGWPHVTPVWVDYKHTTNRVIVNTERGRQKERNIRKDPRISLSMVDPDKPARYLSILGTVDTITTHGAKAHIDALTKRYMGMDTYPNPIETERILVEITPERILV